MGNGVQHEEKLRRKIFQGSLSLTIGEAAGQGSSFVRNIILARVLSQADFGIAALFGTTVQLVEMVSNVGAETFLVQSRNGDEPRLQATAHFYRAVRGLSSGLLILLIAAPAAALFGIKEATWAFRCLALVPVLRGFLHLDPSRLQRFLKYWPNVIVNAGSSCLATLVAIPLAYGLRSYAAMLWVVVAQVASASLLSHVIANRKYEWTFDTNHWRQMVAFGWPLMINGWVLFALFEGDRLIIGSSKQIFSHSVLTLSDLGVYSVVAALTSAPLTLVANIATSLFLPLLSEVQSKKEEFSKRCAEFCQLVAFVSAATAIVFTSGGGLLVSAIYGPKYHGTGPVVAWLAATWALRTVRVAPTVAAMSLGDTKNLLVANAFRSAGLVGMAASAAAGLGLTWFVISGLAGEVLALAASITRLVRKHHASPRLFLAPTIVASSAICSSWFFRTILPSNLTGILLAALLSAATLVLGMCLFFPGFKTYIGTALGAIK